MPFDVRERLCVGSRAVPHTTLENAEVGDEGEEVNLELLDFSSRASEYEWLEDALHLASRHFRKKEFALFEELRGIIRAHRASLRPREGVRERTFLKAQVRGRELLVQNTLRRVVIGMRKENIKEDLKWILQELAADLEAPPAPPLVLQDQDAAVEAIVVAGDGGYLGAADAAPPAVPPPGQGERESLEKQLQEGILKRLREHPECAGASWNPSRLSFEARKRARVEGGKAARHEARVLGLLNIRRTFDANPELPCRRGRLVESFERAQTKLLRLLDEDEAAPAGAEAPDAAALQDAS